MWFISFLALWFLISAGIDWLRGEDIMSIPAGYSDEITLLGWVKVGSAVALAVIVEMLIRAEKRGKK